MTSVWLMVVLFALVAADTDDIETCKFRDSGSHIETLCSSVVEPQLPINLILAIEEDRPGYTLHLRRLEFTNSNITLLQKDVFKLVPKLTQILLTNLSLVTIQNGAFNGITRLKLLDLSNNRIKQLPIDIFRTTQIRHLNLHGNTELEIPTNKPIVHAPFLEWINLGNCGIEHLPSAAFFNMPYLSHISLSHNKLSILPENIFANTSLKFIDLSHNKFSTLSPLLFKNVVGYPAMPQKVLLFGNKWHCDCQLAPLIIWLTADLENHYPTSDVTRTRLVRETVCLSPSEKSKQPWHRLQEWNCNV